MQQQLRVVKSQSGDHVFTINNQPMQDMINPRESTKEKLVKNKIPGDVNHLIIFGFDFGYTADACLDLYDNPHLYIFEPNKTIYKIAAATRTDLLKHKNVHVLHDLDILEQVIMENFERGETIYTIAIQSWQILFKTTFDQFDKKTHGVIRNIFLSENSKDARYNQWSVNVIKNLPQHTENPDMAPLLRRCSNIPCVICSAGPSLSKNIKQLKRIQNKIIIIAVNTAYAALVKNGIVPHFVTAIESYNVGSMFKGLPVKQTNLVTPLVAHPDLQNLPFRNHLTYAHAPSFYHEWGRERLNDTVQLDIGGSVACSSFAFAYLLNANPIILIGQDLAFTEKRMYSAGTKYENEKVEIDKEKGIVTREVKKDIHEASGKTDVSPTVTSRVQYTKGWHGDQVTTVDDFLFFLAWFESASKFITQSDPNRRIINATEGGAWIEGFEHIPLKKALKKTKFMQPHGLMNFVDQLPPKKDFKEKTLNELKRIKTLVSDENKSPEELRDEISLYKAYTRLNVKNKEDLTETRPQFISLLDEAIGKIED